MSEKVVAVQPWYIKYTFALAGIILTIYAMIMAKSLLLPFLFALFFSILLSPVCSKIEEKKIPRIVSSLAGILIAILFIGALGYFFSIQFASFAEDSSMFAERLEELLEQVEAFLLSWFAIEQELNLDRVFGVAIEYIQNNAANLTQQLTGAASILTAIFLIPVYMFLILLFRDLLKNFVIKAIARGDSGAEEKVRLIISKIKRLVQSYINGLVMVILILAVLYSVMLLVIGIEHAIFFGVFAAMLNVIPFVGPLMGSVLPILYSIITMDSLIYPLIILAGFYVVQLTEGNLLTPVIVGSQVSMNALATLILIFAGAQIWGLAGMILFIPLGAIMKIIFDEVESLKPFGYLMGRDTDDKSEERSRIAQRFSKLTEKAKKKSKATDGENHEDEENIPPSGN
ncbi:AI-2E family transporter [Rhodohalobacter mucosus]|uniref:AI-2E family transporter n=1 Tax=Rhodohalobacter mucosus TaxID=2079485 RepID=A0A316TPX4_9BACT|nr:AI-2E family transporter [Rhodohalobacter mucosus]PWN06657.1 AI-2E family transporter [Rhodohalobacter mucosus]